MSVSPQPDKQRPDQQEDDPAEEAAQRLAQLRARLAGFGYGGDYNPEQWTERVWAQDMELMAEAGVNIVSLGIFGWAVVEPRPGEFDWSLFDQIMDMLADNGIGACLATMTASPPPWLAHTHPETLPVTADGVVLGPGARQHFTPSSPVYREHAVRLVENLATRYAEHPALAAWHVGNEYGCHVRESYGDVDAAAFRSWLRRRYGTLEALNEAWSTTFWSQRYGDWDEVTPPRAAPTFGNPAQRIDFRRFSSDALLDCFVAEKQILRRITPDVPITTNFYPSASGLDLFAWAPHLDVVAYDSYPDPRDDRSHVAAGLVYDLMRSLRDGQPWLLMEQAPSAVNWRRVNAPKPPGRMRLGSLQAAARGADTVMFFQWRASRGGAEKFHSAMVPHAGPGTRTFREVAELGRELDGLAEVAGTTVRAEVALLTDASSRWALECGSHPSDLVTQADAELAHYAPLFDAGITCDVRPPSADLSGYRLVVAPNLYLLDESAAANIAEFVRAGGHLVVSFFSGVVDSCDRVHPGGCPGPLAGVLGLGVTEFWPLGRGEELEIAEVEAGWFGAPARARLWSEEIELDGAGPLASFGSGELAGSPAATVHSYGAGRAYYLGCRPEPAAMRRFLDRVAEDAGVTPALPGAPDGVEAVVRHAADGTRYQFVLNHSAETAEIRLAPGALDVRSGSPLDRVRLEPRDAVVVQYQDSGHHPPG